MKKEKTFKNVVFAAETVEAAVDAFTSAQAHPKSEIHHFWRVGVGAAIWTVDTAAEFFAHYREGTRTARITVSWEGHEFWMQIVEHNVNVQVTAPARPQIERVFAIFDSAALAARVPEEVKQPTVFVGHGRSTAWRDLKDHLHEQHGFNVEAYEVGARAGHAIRDILHDMLEHSAFALLVLTAEDETADGQRRARQNVIHELGLFQGRLGFARAVVLLEEGTEEFSNLQGIHQIRFRAGNIREAFGDVLATLRREFGSRAP